MLMTFSGKSYIFHVGAVKGTCNGMTDYCKEMFSQSCQEELTEWCHMLIAGGAYILLLAFAHHHLCKMT